MTNRQKADTTTEHDSFLLTGVQSHTCNTKKSNPFQSKCIAFTYKIYYIKNIPAGLQPCILSTVVAVAILVLCVQGHPSVAVHVCMFFIMSWVEIHVVGMSSASNSVFYLHSICCCSNSAALAGVCLKWPTTFLHLVRTLSNALFCRDTVTERWRVWVTQGMCSNGRCHHISYHISCTVCKVCRLYWKRSTAVQHE